MHLRKNVIAVRVMLLATGVGCSDATVALPRASPFATDVVRLGMSPRELVVARPVVEVGSDGVFREFYFGDVVVYGFSPRVEGRAPGPTASLRYIERTEELSDSVVFERRWAESLTAFSSELGVEASCARQERGSSSLRMARFKTDPAVILTGRLTRSPDGRKHDAVLTTAVLLLDAVPAANGHGDPDPAEDSQGPCLPGRP